MVNGLYKFGDKTIKIKNLVAIGSINNIYSGRLVVPVALALNTNIDCVFSAGVDGMPHYCNHKEDTTEEDSDFYKAVQEEIDKLELTWIYTL